MWAPYHALDLFPRAMEAAPSRQNINGRDQRGSGCFPRATRDVEVEWNRSRSTDEPLPSPKTAVDKLRTALRSNGTRCLRLGWIAEIALQSVQARPAFLSRTTGTVGGPRWNRRLRGAAAYSGRSVLEAEKVSGQTKKGGTCYRDA